MYFFVNERSFWTNTLLLLSFVNFAIVSGACPSRCSCKWKSGKQTVECMEKGLISIPENIDMETQVFDASGNNLQTLLRETFLRSGLVNLQRLFLRHCKIGLVDDLALKGLTNLIELDISHNLLTAIPSKIFKETPFLRELIISNNPIQKIGSLAFQDVHGLMKLDLSHCEVQTIALRAFEGIEMLESLKLNGNRLTELSFGTIETLSRLHAIELHNNPWYCDCRLRAIKEWLTKTNILHSESLLCLGGPERLINKSFKDLHLDDFACKPEILPSTRFIESVTESNVSIICRANAIPTPHIKWFWNGKQLQNNSLNSLSSNIHIYEEGVQETTSLLVFDNLQEMNSFELYCVAENRAGNSEANFTLFVTKKRFSITHLQSAHLVVLSAALVLFIVVIIIIVFLFLARLGGGLQQSKTRVQQTLSTSGVANAIDSSKSELSPCNNETQISNLYSSIQKTHRTTEIPYSTVHYNGNGSIMSESCFVLPSSTVEDGDVFKFTNGEYTKNIDTLFMGNWENGLEESTINECGRNPDLIDNNLTILDESNLDISVPSVQNAARDYPSDYGLPIAFSSSQENILPSNTKTLRIWQKGAVPVLPPVSSLKRVLGQKRNSPDEGFQEGCGTDV